MARWRMAAGIGTVAVLAVAAAFVLSKSLRGEPEVIASEPAVAAPSATPTPTSDPDPMPALHNTGDDFDRIARSLLALRYWMYRHPDQSDLGRIYVEECECWAIDNQNLEELIASGHRFSRNEPEILNVEFLDRASDVVSLKVEDRSDQKILVGDDGHVVDRQVGWESRSFRLLLVLGEDGRWRIRDVKSMSGSGVETTT